MSALETLLEAARYIELQEQRGSMVISPSPIHSTLNSTSSNSISVNGGGISSGNNGIRFQQNHHHHQQQQQQQYYHENSPNNNNNGGGVLINSRNTTTNIINNNNTTRQQQQHLQNNHLNNNHQVVVISSPSVSPPGFNLINGNGTTSSTTTTTTNNIHHQQQQQQSHINNHDFSINDYTVVVPNGRSINGRRIEQPFFNHNTNNGHSISSSSSADSTTISNHLNNTTINLLNNINSTATNSTSTNNTTTKTTTTSTINNIQQYNKTYTKHLINNNGTNKQIHHNSNNNNNNKKNPTHMKFIPLTPPPMSSRKLVESTRIRSISLSSNKILANNGNNHNGNICTTSTLTNSIGVLGSSSSIINTNTNTNVLVAATTEDSSQSSLNLSSSGYLSGSSVNSSNGGSNLNLNTSIGGQISIILPTNNNNNNEHQLPIQTTQQPLSSTGGGRRRTTSTNSNGNQRSPCILRAGTREVHNKLEKHRRAHLKECFEQLKVQLQLKDEEKKKTSNLAILGAAYRHVISLRRKERELEQQVEQLAKEKINAQKKIVSLKRELTTKYDNIDFTTIISDNISGDISIGVSVGSIPNERVIETPCDTVSSLSSGRGSVRYSSSSSLSSGTTISSSPLGAGMTSGCLTLAMSPVISSSSPSSNTSPNSLNMKISSPMIINPVPLSALTGGGKTTFGSNSMMTSRVSPTQSPSPSSSTSGISSLSSPASASSSSPPIGVVKISNGGGIKLPIVTTSSNANNIKIENGIMIPTTTTTTTSTTTIGNNGIPLNFNTKQNVQISHHHNFNNFADIIHNNNNRNNLPKDLTGKNGFTRKNQLIDHSSNRGDLASSPSRVILTNHNGNIGCNGIGINSNTNNGVKEIKLEESEHPTKVIKLINGALALAPIDKDHKIQMSSTTPISLSQVAGGGNGGSLVVSPFSMLSSQGLRVINTNGLATIELTSPQMQSRNHHTQQVSTPNMTSVTSSNGGGAQLHKLLVNGNTTITGTSSIGTGGNTNNMGNCNSTFTGHINGNTVASELARLPGGAELNILPTNNNNTNNHSLHRGYGKLSIVNNNNNNNNNINTLKADTGGNNCGGRAVHVVTPIQSGNSPISGLTPIVVSQGQTGNNLAHIIATTPQLNGKVNVSVNGQTVISAQYLNSMKPVVVAVTNHSNPTLSSSIQHKSATTIATTPGKMINGNLT